jgi:hypothetical protein
MGHCLEVSRADPGVMRIAGAGTGPPGEGEVLFTVERFGLSANNVTYAALGDALRYWDLFPAEPGWGRVPAWGYLRVRSSRVPGIEAGRRAFGLCPMATEVMLRPVRTGEAAFTEGSAHRSGLAGAYNVYSWADAATPGTDDVALVLRPVFWLSFTLDDHLSRQVPGTRPVIVTSASSKAALGLAYLLARRGVPVTGLTSARHYPFVAGLGRYDQVVPYERAETVPAAGAVLADIAGSTALRDRIGRHAGRPAQVVTAGLTHPDAVGPPGGGSGVGFFVPDEIRARAREWGWPALEERFGAALDGFARSARSWLRVVRHRGLGSAGDLYQAVLAGHAGSPADAHVVDVAADSGR